MSHQNDQVVSDVTILLKRAQNGDERAMEDLLLHITPFVRRLCLPLAQAHSADAAQEALLAIYRGIRGLREPSAFYSWVRAVTTREAVRTAKRIGRRTTDELSEAPHGADPFVSIDVSDVLGRLPDYHREVLTLRAYYGMDEQEMATILELPVGTVRSRLFRARRNFQNAWHQRSA